MHVDEKQARLNNGQIRSVILAQFIKLHKHNWLSMLISINIVKSNQNDTDKTILNSIILKGEFTNNDTCYPDMNIFKIETNNYCHHWCCQTCSYSNTTNIT